MATQCSLKQTAHQFIEKAAHGVRLRNQKTLSISLEPREPDLGLLM